MLSALRYKPSQENAGNHPHMSLLCYPLRLSKIEMRLFLELHNRERTRSYAALLVRRSWGGRISNFTGAEWAPNLGETFASKVRWATDILPAS